MIEVIVGISALAAGGAAGFAACRVIVAKALKEKESEYEKVISEKDRVIGEAKKQAEPADKGS
ncbi:MAG: hypothetical protein Q9M89_10005 [Persephonella sp.]|nr:hypothetical protein [Persephonella sp.]